ncbi:MAG: vWA domain-containing protein [Thermoguttaceae bacterium]
MSFAHPPALLLLLMLVPVALLYWLRVRTPSRTVGTGLFWQRALAEEKVRRRWQRWRSTVSLVVQTIIVALIAVAAAGPQVPAPKQIVLIIDNSATMRATDVLPTRIDKAKETARRLIESLQPGDEMAVVMVSPAPVEVQPLTNDRGLLTKAVDSVQGQAEPPAIESAVKLAREIPMPDKDGLKPGLRAEISPRIVLITDACSREATKRVQESGVEVLRVGTAAGNVAITCFTARRSKAEPARCEVLVEVRNRGDQPAQGTMTIAVDDKNGPSAQFSIVKDGRWQHVFTLDLPAAARFVAKIEPGDFYGFDDTAVLDVAAAPAVHRVKLVGEERSGLKEILAANRRVELIQDDTHGKAICVIDGKTPETLPSGPVLIFAAGACDLWQLGEAVANPLVTRVDDRSPIMAGVRLFDAYLPEARKLQIAESVRAIARPIMWADATPLGYAIDRPQGRVVVIAGDFATSNLALQAGFPQLIAQSLDWLDGQPPWQNEIMRPARGEAGQLSKLSTVEPYPARAYGERPTRQVENLFCCGQGIDIRVPNNIGSEASALVLEKPWPPLWIVPAALAAALVIIEWCLYQRRWTS